MKAVQERLREGLIVNHRYQIESFWREEDAEPVYLCRDLGAGKARARMRIVGAGPLTLGSVASFSREFALLLRLRHPNLIRTLDFGVLETSRELFLVEEWIEAQDVYSETEGMDPEKILDLIIKISKALRYLHARGIVHGNLNCLNTILYKSGETHDIKLQGFGLLHHLPNASRRRGFGTLAYLAPEVLMGAGVNESSDMYSLGVMIYQLLARRQPFEDEDAGFLMQKHLQGSVDLRPIERLRCGAGVSQLVCSLLDKDPSRRPATGKVVAQVAGELLGRDSVCTEIGDLENHLSASRFVGREKEMLLLQQSAERVRSSGRGWTIFVTGEAGSGKTRCMEELRSWALLEGWRVIDGACGTHEKGSYGPFRQILATTEAPDGETIFQFNDIPRVVESGTFDSSSEFAAGQFRDLLTRELVRRLTERPTLLLLHDFHLADEATGTVLDYLSSDVQSHPILMCVSLRSGEGLKGILGRLMESSIRQERGEVLNLEALTKENVQQLVAGMTGEHEFKKTLGTWMFGSIGGNPFFLEEMLKHLVEQGLLKRELDRWRFTDQDLQNLEVPAGVGAVLHRRLLQLSPLARDLANWLALFHRPISKRVLNSALSWDSADFAESLQELSNRQMIRIEMNDPEENVEFCHSLIAEVIRGDLPQGHRRRMHRRIADVLVKEYGAESHLQELAMHYMESIASKKGIEQILMAAKECRSEHSNEGALKFYEYILNNKKLCSAMTLSEITIQAAACCCAIGTPARAIELLSGQLRYSHKTCAETKVKLMFGMSEAYRYIGDANKVEKYANKALMILKKGSYNKDPNMRAALLTQLAFCQLLKSRPHNGLKLVKTALSFVSENKTALAGQIYSVISALRRVSCDLDSARKAANESIKILEPLENYQMLAVAYSHLGVSMVALGRLELALLMHKKAVELSEKTRSLPLRSQALSNFAECLCRQGKLVEAKLVSEKAVKLSIECGNPNIRHSSLAILAEIKINNGEYLSAGKIVNELNNDSNQFLAVFSKAHVCYLLAWLYFKMADFEKALFHIEKLHELENVEAPVYEQELADALSALILFQRGRRSEAIQLLMKLNTLVSHKRWPYHQCVIMLYLGECLISESNLLRARRFIRDAKRLAKAMKNDLLLANANLLMGRLLMPWAPKDCAHLMNVVKPEIESAINLSGGSGGIEVLWQAHCELSKVEESLSNWEACLHHTSEAARILTHLIYQRPDPDNMWPAPFNHKQSLFQCELRKNYIQKKVKTPAIMDSQDNQIRILIRVSHIINSIRDLDQLLDSVVEQLIHAIGVERVLVFLKDQETGKLELAKRQNAGLNASDNLSDVMQDILEKVSKLGQPFVSADARGDSRVERSGRFVAGESGALLCAPLKTSNSVLGVLYADKLMPAVSLSESLINMFAAFCNLAAIAIDNALAHQKLIREKSELEQYLHHARDEYNEIVGKSAVMEQLRDRIGLAAASPLDILITGESGTGKELVAAAVHRTGRRKSGKFIPVDCGSLSDSLAEAELFGYRKGAFTGAIENRQGLLEAAQGGIILLDEISNLPFRLQAKLLRVLQEREVRRIGETMPRGIDVQVMAATNRDLLEETRQGRFRGDLYYRLKAMEIRVPALRDHSEDIPLLIEWYLEKIAQSEGGRFKKYSAEAKALLKAYHYPGNVRELKNIVAESYYSSRSQIIEIGELPPEVRQGAGLETSSEAGIAGRIYVEIIERRGTFEELVRGPFLNHQFGSSVVRGVVERALRDSGGKYRDAFVLLRIPDRSYSMTMQFLKRKNCYLDFRPFRCNRRGSIP